MSEPHFYLFTDGSCGRGKDDIGAWAAFVVGKNGNKLLYGSCHPATVSRMEMTPILEGMRWIQGTARRTRGIRVRAYSDSEFVVKTLGGGYDKSKNRDLWAALDEVTQGLNVEYRWRERNSHFYMQLCDAVCSRLRRRTMAQAVEMLGDWKTPETIIPAQPLPVEEDDVIQQTLTELNAGGTHAHNEQSVG
jgi:ribonuclease HI